MLKSKFSSRLAVLAGLFLLWYTVSLLWQIPIIPSPWRVLEKLSQIFLSKLVIHALYSIWRIAAGIGVSLLVGVPIGLCMGYFRLFDRVLSPVVYFLYPIPKIALLPIVMLLFGLGESAKIFMISMIIIFQVMVTARDSVKGIPQASYYSMISLGAGRTEIFRRVIIPASVPELLTAIRIGLGTAVSVLFFTETFGTRHGMGFFIMDAWMRVNYLEMYAGILVLSVIGFGLFSTIDVLERTLCRWKS